VWIEPDWAFSSIMNWIIFLWSKVFFFLNISCMSRCEIARLIKIFRNIRHKSAWLFQKDGTHCYKVKQKLNLLKYNSFSFNQGMSFQHTICNKPYELTSFSTLEMWNCKIDKNISFLFRSLGYLQSHKVLKEVSS
jgi:hypothetical protein